MNRALALAPLAVLAVLVVVGIFLLTRDQERETFSAGVIGRPAPVYALEGLGGGLVTSEDRAGRAYVINVFASWCAPCRVEHPLLMQLHDEGVDIVGVAYKDRPENTARFLNELGNPFSAIGLDPSGRFALELGFMAAPETFVIGADGRVMAVHRGALTPEAIEQTLRPALSSP